MFSSLRKLIYDMFGSAVSRMIDGAGLAVLTLTIILPTVQGALQLATSAMGGISGDIASLVYLSGIGVAITNIGGALMTAAWLDSQKVAMTKKTGST